MRNKSLKWALIAVSCALLAALSRGCAPEYNQTQAQVSNNSISVVNYIEQTNELNIEGRTK